MPSFPLQTGGKRKTVTFDSSLLSPSRGVKRSVDEADLYLDDAVVERRRHPEWMAADRLISNSITYNINTFTPTSSWAARAHTAWDSPSIYDEGFEAEAVAKVPIEAVATEHGLSPGSTSTTKIGLYTEISRAISRLIEGGITRNELIERLQRVASQLKQWG